MFGSNRAVTSDAVSTVGGPSPFGCPSSGVAIFSHHPLCDGPPVGFYTYGAPSNTRLLFSSGVGGRNLLGDRCPPFCLPKGCLARLAEIRLASLGCGQVLSEQDGFPQLKQSQGFCNSIIFVVGATLGHPPSP